MTDEQPTGLKPYLEEVTITLSEREVHQIIQLATAEAEHLKMAASRPGERTSIRAIERAEAERLENLAIRVSAALARGQKGATS